MSDKKLPTRRDRREAEGYLNDLFDVDGITVPASYTPAGITDRLLGAADEVKVQRSMGRLALYFDLDDEGEQLPEATDGDSTEHESRGIGVFRPADPDNDTPAGVGG